MSQEFPKPKNEKQELTEKEQRVVKEYLGEKVEYKKRVHEAIIQATRRDGGVPRIETIAFTRYVIGSNRQIPSDELSICKKEVLRIVNEIKREKKEEAQKNGLSKKIEDSQRKEWNEERRSGPIQDDLF